MGEEGPARLAARSYALPLQATTVKSRTMGRIKASRITAARPRPTAFARRKREAPRGTP